MHTRTYARAQELMVLGLVAFGLFLISNVQTIDEHQKHLFEIVHMTLFSVPSRRALLAPGCSAMHSRALLQTGAR